ncbi:MAG: 3-deoxy-D-manno-octulosonic acid transferase [Kiritimatiellia bacterium]|jgi:3-deoxy-D-manno-octulosonic-acid transferase
MRWFLYNILFAIGYTLMLPKFFARMRRRGGYRADFGQRLGRFAPETAARLAEKPRIWVHAVSVGEANLAGAVLRELRRLAPDESFILSTTSSTGHAVCERLVGPDDVLIYLPVDFPHIVRRSLKIINAKALVLTESEFWPNLIRSCRRRGLPVFLVNGRISDRSAPRYRRLRCFFAEVFDCFTAMLVQSDRDRERLVAAGAPADRVQVAGSVKFDVAPPTEAALDTARQTLAAAGIEPGVHRILLGGSTWPGEEAALAEAWTAAREAVPGLRLVLVPRHMERGDALERELAAAGFRCLRRSRMKTGRETQAPGPDAILMVDTTGELFPLYALADLVFVGKTLDPNIGGQNMIEPASFGKAVVCGPHTENFASTMEIFRAADAIREVADAAGLHQAVGELAADAARCAALGERARRVVESQRGALERTAQAVLAHLR